MKNEKSIASSLRISCSVVGEAAFDQFEKSLGAQPRSTVILEFSVSDVMTNFCAYLEAHTKLDQLGYRVMIGDVDLRALLWLNYNHFDADFVKVKLPEGDADAWLSPQVEQALQDQIAHIGIARVILDGCNTSGDIELGQRLGVTLFQGVAVAAMTT